MKKTGIKKYFDTAVDVNNSLYHNPNPNSIGVKYSLLVLVGGGKFTPCFIFWFFFAKYLHRKKNKTNLEIISMVFTKSKSFLIGSTVHLEGRCELNESNWEPGRIQSTSAGKHCIIIEVDRMRKVCTLCNRIIR